MTTRRGRWARLTAICGWFGKQARSTTGALKGLGGGFKSALTAVSPFTIGAAGAVAILARGVGQAREFSKGIAEVNTILPQGGREFGNLTEMVRNFADQVGRSSTDVVPAPVPGDQRRRAA